MRSLTNVGRAGYYFDFLSSETLPDPIGESLSKTWQSPKTVAPRPWGESLFIRPLVNSFSFLFACLFIHLLSIFITLTCQKCLSYLSASNRLISLVWVLIKVCQFNRAERQGLKEKSQNNNNNKKQLNIALRTPLTSVKHFWTQITEQFSYLLGCHIPVSP